MSKGYFKLPQFPGSAASENTSKFRFSVRTPTSENTPHSPGTDRESANYIEMSDADAPLIPPNGNFDDEDYLSEGNRQSYGSNGNDKNRRKRNGFCSQCWWYLCCGWKDCCYRQVYSPFKSIHSHLICLKIFFDKHVMILGDTSENSVSIFYIHWVFLVADPAV